MSESEKQATLARHLNNRAELLAAIEAQHAKWAGEDRATEAARAEHLARMNDGVVLIDAVIVAAGGVVPVAEPAVAEPEPEPETPIEDHHDDERHEV